MSISEQDIKLLWGRAAAMCAFESCRKKLTQNRQLASDTFPLGEQAHIVALKEDSARGKSNLTEQERNSYFNLVLLCPNHHTEIDKNPEVYTVEKLHYIKDQHEYWVEHTLSESHDSRETAQSVIYAHLIDTTVEACQMESWDKWTFRALAAANMQWDRGAHERLFKYFNQILGAIWPKTLPELECAIKKLASEIYQAIETFSQRCERCPYDKNMLVEDRYYKKHGWLEQSVFDEQAKEYQAWVQKCVNHIIEATKAANWFADIVRRDINLLFFATKGKFFLMMGPYDMLEFRSCFFEYTEEEKREIIDSCAKGWSIAQKFDS